MGLSEQLERWVDAQLIDTSAADRIRQFEKQSNRGRLGWPAILAIGFGALMLCAGVLLFVAAHWDELSPAHRFTLVLSMVAVFHLLAGALGKNVPAVGVALHFAGTVCLGAGIYLAGQIFNLEEHWPSAVLLWGVGAILAWIVLRQWPQALLAAVLLPWWLCGEWSLATQNYSGATWNIAAQGLLLLCIFYLSVTPQEPHRALRSGLIWIGGLSFLPLIIDVLVSGEGYAWSWHTHTQDMPPLLQWAGYLAAYVPVVVAAAILRKGRALPIFLAALWVFLLAVVSRQEHIEKSPSVYLWLALGACAFCYWGVRDGRKLFINFGTAIFAIDVITFYFSDVLDKLGRSMGLILLGAIFLAGGWVLNRLRSDLIARAAAGGNQ